MIETPATVVPELFHYTTPDAFLSILKSGTIWLTNAAYLNDPGELTYPADLARSVLERWPSGGDVSLRRYVALAAGSLATHALYKHWYIASFSTEGNVLSQWRAYCRAGGYSIGVDGATIQRVLRPRHDLQLRPVLYDPQSQSDTLIAVLEKYFSAATKNARFVKKGSEESCERDFSYLVGRALTEELIFFKSPAFSEEREWRLARSTSSVNVMVRDRAGTLTPYVEIDLKDTHNRLPVSSVFVSPLGDQELARYTASLVLKERLYEQPAEIIKSPGYRLRY